MSVHVGTQNIDGCTFEEDSCGFAGVNWMRERTSPTGLHHENTFQTAFGELHDEMVQCYLKKLLKCASELHT